MKGYTRYFGKKFLWYFATLIIALALNFFLPRLIPGNPVDMITGQITAGMTDTNTIKKVYDTFNEQFGLDKPPVMQFFIYVGNLFKGDMGTSFSLYPRGVSDILSSALPWTVALQLPAIIVGWLLGNILGALAAYIKGVFDKAIFPLFLFISALPMFGLAIIFVFVFANTLKWFPSSGGYGFDIMPSASFEFFASAFKHYQLPFWSIVLVTIGGQSLGMREMSIYELNADYVKYSRLLGIKDSVIVKYVFRNAMLPQITGLALSLGTMVGGSLITEIVFSYPGLGSTMLTAITSQDFPLISGCTLIITLTVLVANFLVEMLYGVIDPRIKATQQE